jgi:phenylacetate-CoA ligase
VSGMPAMPRMTDLPLCQEIQSKLLRNVLQITADRHPFYSRVLDTPHWISRINSDSFGSDDLVNFPLTSRNEFSSDPTAFRLRDSSPPNPDDIFWDVVYTTGTSGPPVPIYQTAIDYKRIIDAQIRMSEIRGITQDDRIVNLFPIAPRPTGSLLRISQGLLALGATVLSGATGVGDVPFSVTHATEDLIEPIFKFQPTVIWGMPNYVRRVIKGLVSDSRPLTRLRMLVVSGESASSGLKDELRDLSAKLGAENCRISEGFGTSEMQVSLVDCAEGSGLHNPAPDQFLLEVVDDQGNRVADGEDGLLAVTHLQRTGTLLIRYLTGDRVRASFQPCERCGRVGGRILEHLGRNDRLTNIKGTLVDGGRLVWLLEQERAIQAFRFLVQVLGEAKDTRDHAEELVVQVQWDSHARTDHIAEALRVRQTIKEASGITVRIESVDADFVDTWLAEGQKVARFVDLRLTSGGNAIAGGSPTTL